MHCLHLAGVGVIKAHEHLALVLLSEVLIEQSGLGMTNVEVA